MKKSFVIVTLIVCHLMACKAQVVDAFGGILPVTDKQMMRSLNGEWKLKVVEGIKDDSSVLQEDGSWGTIPVPGCWEAYGFCKPTYDKADPLTGYYRTAFEVPLEWKGQRIVLRFDGVLYGYDLWINGKKAGSWRSGYNTALFDVTPFLNKKAAKQELSMRVISRFPGSDFDYNDDWTPNGIFRDVTLMAVPETHIEDITITPKLTGEVDIKLKVSKGGKGTSVKHEILDAQGNIVGTTKVENPQLWTAETPYLYTLRTTLLQKNKALQTFEHKFGFRELTIEGNVLKLNGQPIKLRGVTCHSTDPKTVKVIDEASILRDMRLMKEASVNYIRTSHYPREPRFYELADSLGFYIIDEVPFGYGDKNLRDSTFYPVLQQRAQATIRRDKNHPSVLIWSLGNENPLTEICEKLGDYVKKELDSTRPICYPQVGSYFRRFNYDFPKVADIYAPHYPTTDQIGGFYQRADRPVIFTEYCHTLGISFEDHNRQWEIIEKTPCIAGGSVWEWVDQGMPFRCKMDDVRWMMEDGRGKMYGYEEKVFTSGDGGFEMYGNKGTDGLLYADRTPLPNYYELQHNYARAFVRSVSCGSLAANLEIVNRYDFLNLKDEVDFHWVLTLDRDTVNQGTFRPDCPPHSTVSHHFPLPLIPNEVIASSHYVLHFALTDVEGHTFLRQSFVLNKPKESWEGSGDNTSMIQEGPLVRTGRKPTLAEKVTQKERIIERYLLPLDNKDVVADVQTKAIKGGQEVTFTLTPDTADVFRAELGLAYLLDKNIDRVQWIGQGPFASYPGRYKANCYGFWAKEKDDLYFEGNHGGVDAAFFSDRAGNGLLVVGDSLNINFEQTDKGIVMTVNAAVSGQGPKFAKTRFPGWKKGDKPVTASFRLYYIEASKMPENVKRLFMPAKAVPAPLHPFVTQYDTYLMKYEDIKGLRD